MQDLTSLVHDRRSQPTPTNEFSRAQQLSWEFQKHRHTHTNRSVCQERFRNGWIGEKFTSDVFPPRPATLVGVEARPSKTPIWPAPSWCCAGAGRRGGLWLHRQTVVRFPSPAARPESTMRCPTACRASCWTLCFLSVWLMVGTSVGEWRNLCCLQPVHSLLGPCLSSPHLSQKPRGC